MKATLEIQGFNQFKEEVLELLSVIQLEVSQLKAEKEGVEYFSVSYVANRLGISGTKVRMMFHDGELDGKQSTGGKKILISRESLEAFEKGKVSKVKPFNSAI